MGQVSIPKSLLNQVFGEPFTSTLFRGGEDQGISTINDDGPSRDPKAPRTSIIIEEDGGTSSAPAEGTPVDKEETVLERLASQIREQLNGIEEEERRRLNTIPQEGRLGPSVVKMDVGSHVGSFIISNDRLGVSSQCNFGSLRASTCVYKGKWQFELQLGSNGVMQVGWATLETKFSQEKGVGDTIDSYAYDGNRMRKWNKSTAQYGESWQAGDIIGCGIDLDKGEIQFWRNGRSLGVAFKDIVKGQGVAYFPAISLAFQESIVANFGATPFQFPVQGFSPLQSQRTADNMKCILLLTWFEKLLPLYQSAEFLVGSGPHHRALLLLTNRLIEFLGPHLRCAFAMERAFYPFFARLLGLPPGSTSGGNIGSSGSTFPISVNNSFPQTEGLNYDKVLIFLDTMWTLLEETETKGCLERLCIIMLNQFRSNSMTLEYPAQRYSLMCLVALTKHRKTRRHFIRTLLLDKSARLFHFLHVRPIDESVLNETITPWWRNKENEESLSDSSPSEKSYKDGCARIRGQVEEIERLQVLLLKTLLNNDDGTDKRPSSRALFLRKLRSYIRDVIRPGSVLHQPVQKPLCAFFCFLKTIRELHGEEVVVTGSGASGGQYFPLMPPSLFYDTSLSYFEMERVGGLANYLYKAHHAEVSDKLKIPDYVQDKESPPPGGRQGPSGSGLGRDPSSPLSPVQVTVTATTTTQDNGITITALPPREFLLSLNLPPPPPPLPPPMPISTVQSAPMPGPPPLPLLLERARGVAHGFFSNATATSSEVMGNPTSNTSSEESIGPPSSMPTFGAVVTGTPSGHNMLIPVVTEFRNGGGGFSLFPGHGGGFLGFGGADHHRSGGSVMPQNPAIALLGKDCGRVDPLYSLRELLDDAIIIFNSGVSSTVEKAVNIVTALESYREALKSATAKLDALTNPVEREEIQRSINIFMSKLEEQARHMAWIEGAVFTRERQTLVYELLKTILTTLNAASGEGNLFTFVPEHYVSTMINLNTMILSQLHPTVNHENISDLPQTWCQIVEFVATHFADSRIVIAETKDTLTQALGTYICNPKMLQALEQVSGDSQIAMVKSILRPYENRAWAQSNWMLVRIWQGDGFAFQYPNSTDARKSYQIKHPQDEYGISTYLPPNPSKVFQNHVANILLDDQKFAISFLHSVLNQLNWAFSEFVGMLQDIQAASNRPERVFIESRQLKICCTCFELTHALLRVLEMIATIASPVITDFSRDSAEPLLARLSMLLSQVMNRIGSNSGSFANVVDLGIPGLENVQYFPILSAVAGILVAIVKPELKKPVGEIPATKTILNEPSFMVSSLDFMFGRNQTHVPEGREPFSLENFVPADVTEEEMGLLNEVVNHLGFWTGQLQSGSEEPDEDHICPICYAYPLNATLKPCNHRTCKTCIQHHLMNRGDCFFCKANIQQVFLDDGTKIHDANFTAKITPQTRGGINPAIFHR